MVFRNILRRKTRSLLTILGIAIGVATVVAMGNIAQSLLQNYGNIVGGSNDLLVMQADAADVVFSTLDEEVGEQLKTVPGVENVDPGAFAWITAEELSVFLVYGYPPGSRAMEHYRIVEGKPVTGPQQIAIGRRAADTLNKGVDETLRLQGTPYRIVGIYETGQGLEESGGVVALEHAQEIAGKPRKVSLFQVGLGRNVEADAVIQRIENMNDDLSVSKTSEYQAGGEWAGVWEGFAWSIAGIAILVGGLGMMNTMFMTVMERTREIGTLRAVGWSRPRIVSMIMGESLVLSIVGGIIGMGIGILMTEGAGMIPGMGAFLEGGYSSDAFVQGMITALLLGVVGGVLPAWRAANMQPVEALRYESGGASNPGGILARIGSQSFRNLWRQRNRTLISAVGIGIGVATVVLLGGLTEGLVGQLNSLAGSGSPGSITVMQADAADMSLSSLDERMVGPIRAMPHVESVSPVVLGFISTEDLPFFLVFGLDPLSPAMSHYTITEGRNIRRPTEILLGAKAADNLSLGVDDTMQLYSNRYKIVGIYETGVAYEEGGSVLALKEAQRLLNRPRTFSYLFVDVDDPGAADQVTEVIERRFPETRATLSSQFAQNTNDIQNSQALMGAIKGLGVLVAGIVVANTMIMSVYERTREVGTLRALGWGERRIVWQVIAESIMLCLVSALVGSLLGVGLLTLLANTPGANAVIEAKWNPMIFVQAVGLTLLMGVLGGAYPAWRASRLQPAEALRYE